MTTSLSLRIGLTPEALAVSILKALTEDDDVEIQTVGAEAVFLVTRAVALVREDQEVCILPTIETVSGKHGNRVVTTLTVSLFDDDEDDEDDE